MKRFIIGTVVLVSISIASITQIAAQLRFEVPLTVIDGSIVQSLFFGILPAGNFCINGTDSINGHVEFFLPPIPMSGVFDARLVWPRDGSQQPACFQYGALCDYRPFVSTTQKDTFRISGQRGVGPSMELTWPAGLSAHFTALTLRFFDGSANVNINMLTETTADVTAAGNPAIVTVYSGGLVTSVEQAAQDVPGVFALDQNYPNPFNPSTRISFSTPHSSFVILKLYDLLGREVATLVNEQVSPGAYERTFSAEGLAGGVYFYKLQAAGFVQTKKLLLLR
jgi:hypothetical protein